MKEIIYSIIAILLFPAGLYLGILVGGRVEEAKREITNTYFLSIEDARYVNYYGDTDKFDIMVDEQEDLKNDRN